ncbi:MAG: LysM peptidoglycan-binding domain-containing protein, partial [Lachnospiraceae bacterium]|nr:LysM peptidoglycan-binding domain-containing protein [Lachnospiraceae bacterium]
VTTQMGDEAVNSGIVEYYTVKRGDSLYKIARKNHLTINDIYRMNKELMKQRYIYAGQKVRIK